MTIREAHRLLISNLATVYEAGEARSIARIVFEDAFGVRNFQRSDRLAPVQLTRLRTMQSRLLAMEPVQYVVGQADFFGMTLKVDNRVLIPRQETEELVEWILATQKIPAAAAVLDIGAGSGCIALALKKHRPAWEVEALDRSSEALSLARENAGALDLEVSFREWDILDRQKWPQLPRFDLIVSNPPYIAREEEALVGKNVLDHEPEMALFVEGEDPLLFYRAIAGFGRRRLTEGGYLFFELNAFNADRVAALVAGQGFADVAVRKDLNGKQRMLRARWS